MAQTIKVNIVGDSSAFERSLSRAATGTKAFAKHAGLATLAVGGFAAYMGTKAVRAAIDEQKEMTKLTAAFKAQGLQMDASSKQVQALEEAGKKLGFTDDDTRAGLTKLIQAGRSYTDATKQLAVAQDLARSSGQSLGDATTGLIRLQAGNVRVAKQYGIVLPDLTAKQWKAKAAADGLTLAQEKGKFAYDALTKKISGQADAFTHTAAGAAATFQANLQDLEEEIGTKLLPALTSVISTVNAHWPQISATIDAATQGIGYAINNIAKPAIESLIAAGQVAVAWFQANWPEISARTMSVFNTVKAVVMTTVAVIRALWAQFGSTIVAQTKATWEAIRSTVQNVLNVIRGIVNIIGGLMHGDWSRVWKGIQQVFGGVVNQILAMARFWATALRNLVQAAFTAMVGVIRAAVGAALAAARAVGEAIVNGIKAGLSQLVAVVKGGLDRIWGVISEVAASAYNAAKAIGAQIIHGIAAGIRGAIGDAVGAIRSAGGTVLKEAQFWHRIGSPSRKYADEIGKPIMQGWAAGILENASLVAAAIVQAAQKALAAKGTLIDAFRSMANEALAAFDQQASNWTPPAAKKLAAMQREDTINQATKQVADAQKAVDDAVAAGDQDAITQAVQQLGEAQRNAQEVQLQLDADQQQKAHDARMAKERDQFAKELAQREAFLAKYPEQWRKVNLQILALFDKYNVPMFEAGKKFASRFADGLTQGIAAVAKAARALAEALDKYVPHSPAKKGPLAYDSFDAGHKWASRFSMGVAAAGFPGSGALGGPSPALAAAGAGGGPVNITVNMPNYLGDVQTAAREIRAELLRIDRRNGGLGFT